MSKKYFVAGTDTGVGKTLVSAALLHVYNARGQSTLGLKPVAAGCEETDDGLQNEDAQLLKTYSSIKLPYQQINPIALKLAIAPHIAASHENRNLSVSRIQGVLNGAFTEKADVNIIEGAGGWKVPLNRTETMADLAKALNLPVILVVGVRLGCINHALLSAEAIVRDGLTLAGWVANHIDAEMPFATENVEALKSRLSCPCMGEIPFIRGQSVEIAAKYLQV